MSGKSPWSVKGVSAEDREAAKIAARKAGMPIGVWLSEQIRQASGDELPEEQSEMHASEESMDEDEQQYEPAPGQQQPDHDPRRGGQVDPRFAFGRGQWSVAEEAVDKGVVASASAGYPWQFRSMAPAPQAPQPNSQGGYLAPVPQSAPPTPPSPPALPGPAANTDSLERRIAALEQGMRTLSERLTALESKTLARFEPVLSKIELLNDDIEKLQAAAGSAGTAPVNDAGFSTAPIERAVMRLSERLGRVERIVLPGQKGGRGFFSRLFHRG